MCERADAIESISIMLEKIQNPGNILDTRDSLLYRVWKANDGHSEVTYKSAGDSRRSEL